jgi:hypothetical protein
VTRLIPGVSRQSRLPSYDIRDFVPSGNVLADVRRRNIYSVGYDATQHTSTVLSDTQTFLAENLGRVAKVTLMNTVAAVVDFTVQVIVDGRDIYDDALRPTILAGATTSITAEVPSKHPYKRGDVVQTVIEAVDATQTGVLNVSIETEPYELVPLALVIPLTARQRRTGELSRATYQVPPPSHPRLRREAASFVEATSGVTKKATTSSPVRKVLLFQKATDYPGSGGGGNTPGGGGGGPGHH